MMKPAPPTSLSISRSRLRAFTLLELLVVIAIIGILGGMMFPAVVGVMRHVKNTRTETTATHLRNAINTYYTEYRKLPYHTANHKGDTIVLQSDSELMDILCASESEAGPGGLNPGRKVFYSGSTAKPMGNGRYHSGVYIDSDGSASLYDPWGELYQIILDGDDNGRVDKPEWDSATASHEITSSILVWSKGPDKDNDSGEDNIKVW